MLLRGLSMGGRSLSMLGDVSIASGGLGGGGAGRRWRRAVLAMATLAVLGAACGGGGPTAAPGGASGAAVPQNLFLNPSFEEGDAPWFSLVTPGWGTPFAVSQEVAHSGRNSGLLKMRAAPEDGGTQVFGLIQEITPSQFPEFLSGYYWVDNWTRGTDKQYLQFVVIAAGATNLHDQFNNYQIRYPLAGISEDPFPIANADFIFVGTGEPVEGRWVYFERDIRQDFEKVWGAVPKGFSKLRILFEVRYDGKAPGSGPAAADVYYDDLYLGPKKANPNRP